MRYLDRTSDLALAFLIEGQYRPQYCRYAYKNQEYKEVAPLRGTQSRLYIAGCFFDFRHIRDGLFLIYCVLMFSRKVTCRPIGGRSHYD